MAKLIILTVVFVGCWVLWAFNRKLKRTVNKTAGSMDYRGSSFKWETGDCMCGTSRPHWKALAMNRPDNTVLLICPKCMGLWEEHMNLNGSNWRSVDLEYAKIHYDYNEEYGRARVDT